MKNKAAVIGTGAWGTALATVLARSGCDVQMLGRREDVCADINNNRFNKIYLNNCKLPKNISASTNITAPSFDIVLVVTPMSGLSWAKQNIEAWNLGKNVPIISCTKGISKDNLLLPLEILAKDNDDENYCVLSGPSFADEVANSLPTAVTIACQDDDIWQNICSAINIPEFRLYRSHDMIGVQLGGALKNVIAIASGIIIGMQLGENARAAILARGLAEIMNLGQAIGASRETLMGLAGLGDLSLTCASIKSRNMSLGLDIGKGDSLKTILEKRITVAEGVNTSTAAQLLAQKYKIDCPIIDAVAKALREEQPLSTLINTLLARPRKTHEFN